MAIDRIGKGGAPPPTPETGGADKAQKTGGGTIEKSFHAELHKGEATKHASSVDAAHGATPLQKLRAGEVDVNGYIDLKVDEATKHLDGLSPHEIDEIKKVLRDQMATDPGLVDLARTATGQIPKPPED